MNKSMSEDEFRHKTVWFKRKYQIKCKNAIGHRF